MGEGEASVVVGGPGHRALELLRLAVVSDHRDRLGVEGDRTLAALRLWGSERQAARRRQELAFHPEPLAAEVNSAPSEAEDLATAHPRRGGEAPQRRKAIALEVA